MFDLKYKLDDKKTKINIDDVVTNDTLVTFRDDFALYLFDPMLCGSCHGEFSEYDFDIRGYCPICGQEFNKYLTIYRELQQEEG